MQIGSTKFQAVSQQQQKPKPQPPAQEPPNNRWADAYEGAKRDIADAAVGFVPVMGAYENFKEAMSAGIAGQDFESNVRFAGSIANVAGSAALAVGLVTGNSVATQIGYNALGLSAFTNCIFNP